MLRWMAEELLPLSKSERGAADQVRELTEELSHIKSDLRSRTRELRLARAKQRHIAAKLTTSSEIQVATSKILEAISRSSADTQAILETIVRAAVQLCGAKAATIRRLLKDAYPIVADYGYSNEQRQYIRTVGGRPDGLTAKAADIGKTIYVRNVEREPSLRSIDFSRIGGLKSLLIVPLLRSREAIGVLLLDGLGVDAFAPNQVALAETFADQAVIAIENARLFEAEQKKASELAESLKIQTAMAEILRVIAASPNDLRPVLTAVAQSSAGICEAFDVVVTLREGDVLKVAAHHGSIPAEFLEYPINRQMTIGRAILDRKPVHVLDLQVADDELQQGRDVALRRGFRSIVSVPLVRAGEAVGVISLRRIEVKPFSDKQIALLESFADQAVIAIESARLFKAERTRTKELEESLQYQTAISDVLGVISRSPNELQPVLETIVTTAKSLCEAERAGIWQLREGKFELTAHTNRDPELMQHLMENPVAIGPRSIMGRTVLTRRPIQVADVTTEADLETANSMRLSGIRTLLDVPLLREGEPIGVITLSRQEVAPFNDRQIGLVTTFANQAVIAIENARLFEAERTRTKELQESLAQQTATADVLKVISRSAFDLDAVFETLLSSACRLCEAEHGLIFTRNGEEFVGRSAYGVPDELRDYIRNHPRRAGDGTMCGRVSMSGRVEHIPDKLLDPDYRPPAYTTSLNDTRTLLGVPLLRDGKVEGVFTLMRVPCVPFTQRQIELAETFADQAVIAIENARLFEAEQTRTKELKESLEYQTAISGVLSVISKSPNDLQPIFDAIVITAARLCAAEFSFIMRPRGDLCHYVAAHGLKPERIEWIRQNPVKIDRTSITGRVALTRTVVHVVDVLKDKDYQQVEWQKYGQQRSVLGVPLIRDNELLGVIILARRQVSPFLRKHIGLVETFADQAVIAIENARLFEAERASKQELGESLKQQTATSEVLKVISRSALDLQKVLDTVVESASVLCEAQDALLWQAEGNLVRLIAHKGDIPLMGSVGQLTLPVTREYITGRAMFERRTVQAANIQADGDDYPATREMAIRSGWHTALAVPLIRSGEAIGVIAVRRKDVRPFTQRQIELVETFADQAVIAVENARLFEAERTRSKEVEEKSKELARSLKYQTAIAEVLGVISRSKFDVQPVLDTIVTTAARLLKVDKVGLRGIIKGGNPSNLLSTYGMDEELISYLSTIPLVAGRGAIGRAVSEKRTIHVPDYAGPDSANWVYPAIAKRMSVRSSLQVPLIRDNDVIGTLGLWRTERAGFTPEEIALAETFADQAAIAIENARLLEELQARQSELETRSQELARSVEELRALGEVGKTVSSTLDLNKVLQTILVNACSMSNSSGGALYVFDADDGTFRLEAGHNMSEEHIARVRAQPIRLGDRVVGECGERREAVQIEDIITVPPSPLLGILKRAGVRAVLAVPLLRQDELIGALIVRRNQPGAFSREIVRLIEAFAAQSAIAVNNARLFKEIEEKGREIEIASQHKSQFVANMSHELRTPLAAVLGYAELMKEGIYGVLPEKSLPIVSRMQSNGKHLLGLINTVLDISKIESGQFKLNLGEYALSSMIETVRVATESLASAKKLVFKTEIAKNLPHGLGDETRLTQVLLNLVGNAIKFTDQGEVHISAGASNGHFAVSVSDTGPGIPPEERDKVFEKFHQIDNSNTRTKGGTGLGLAIAKEIVEMHGGRIWVESIVGRGSTFRIDLPVRASDTGKHS